MRGSLLGAQIGVDQSPVSEVQPLEVGAVPPVLVWMDLQPPTGAKCSKSSKSGGRGWISWTTLDRNARRIVSSWSSLRTPRSE
jgi:hypothetical protein